MQIHDVRNYLEPTRTQQAHVPPSTTPVSSRFEETLGSEQQRLESAQQRLGPKKLGSEQKQQQEQRQGFDKDPQGIAEQSAALEPDEKDREASGKNNESNNQEEKIVVNQEQSLALDDEEQLLMEQKPSAALQADALDWHDFLAWVTTESAETKTAQNEGKGLESKNPMVQTNRMDLVNSGLNTAKLQELKQLLTAVEQEELLAGGVLSPELEQKLAAFLGATPSEESLTAVQRFLAQVQQVGQGGLSKQELLNNLPTELKDALASYLQGQPEQLTAWLAAQQQLTAGEQARGAELIANVSAYLASMAEQGLDAKDAVEIKTVLVSLLSLLAEQGTTATQGALTAEQRVLRQESTQLLERLVQTLQENMPQKSTLAVGTQPSQENKVLTAFTASARELRQLIQAATSPDSPNQNSGVSSEGKERDGLSGELAWLGQSLVSSGQQTNTLPHSAVQAQLPNNLLPANVSQQFNRTLAAAQQPMETPFEQARQNQHYIDLFGPQAPMQLKEQIAVMFNNRNQFAEMRLDPPELGRLNIRLQMNSEQQAAVTFHVNSPQAREAIEFALPRLREMLEEQGIQLTESNVREDASQFAQRGEKQSGQQGQEQHSGSDEQQENQTDTFLTMTLDVPEGRIDYYV